MAVGIKHIYFRSSISTQTATAKDNFPWILSNYKTQSNNKMYYILMGSRYLDPVEPKSLFSKYVMPSSVQVKIVLQYSSLFSQIVSGSCTS